MSRFTLLPLPAAETLLPQVDERISAAANTLNRNSFGDIFDGLMREMLRVSFAQAGGHEGTVWLVDRERSALVPVHNSGDREPEFLARVDAQPLSRGLVSGVFLREQSHCQNRIETHPDFDPMVDRAMSLQTVAQIAVPLHFAGAVRGVVSCVRLSPPGDNRIDDSGFDLDGLRAVEFGTTLVGRLLDMSLLELVLGRARG